MGGGAASESSGRKPGAVGDRRPNDVDAGAQPRSRRQPGGGAAPSPDASRRALPDWRPELGVGAKPGLPLPRSGTGMRLTKGSPLRGHGRPLAGCWGRAAGDGRTIGTDDIRELHARPAQRPRRGGP